MAFGRFVEHLAEERERLEHVRLVDAGQAAAHPSARLAAFSQPERKLEQPLRGLAGDDQRLARLVVGDDALAHRGEQAFGGFPDDDEIDAALVGADDRARHARNQPRRTNAGIEIEMKAQFDLRHDLGVVGVAHRRQAAGAEQNRVSLVAQPHRTLRHRLAGLPVMVGTGRRVGEAELQVRRRLDLAQDLERRRHHFGADAIAGEHGDMESVVGGHGVSLEPNANQSTDRHCERTSAIRRRCTGAISILRVRQEVMAGLSPAMTGSRCYGVRTARPTSLPFCRSVSASLALASGIVVTGIGGIFLARTRSSNSWVSRRLPT